MNCFEKVLGIRTKHCFAYGNFIIFVVSKEFMSNAIGIGGANIKKLAYKIRRKVRVIQAPESIEDLESFVAAIISPVRFRNIKLEFENGEKIITIYAPRESKAMIIGRGKQKLEDLKKILEEYFSIKKIKM
jgi:NusA-like KH domain protein